MNFDGTQILIGKGAQDPMSFKMLAGAFAKIHGADPKGVDIPLISAGV